MNVLEASFNASKQTFKRFIKKIALSRNAKN